MAKKKTKTERRNSAIKGWKTRRKNEVKNEKTRSNRRKRISKSPNRNVSKKQKDKRNSRINGAIPVSPKNNSRTPQVKKHEQKKPTRLSISKASPKKVTVKKSARRKTKSAGKAVPKRRTRTVKRAAKTTKKKKAKKSTKTVSRRKPTKRIRKEKAKTKKRKGVTPGTSADKFYRKSNRTYFVTIKLGSGEKERKQPLNVIVWARDGLKDQEVLELLWAMIKRRKDKNLMFALGMEVRELIVAYGPLTDRLQGYRLN